MEGWKIQNVAIMLSHCKLDKIKTNPKNKARQAAVYIVTCSSSRCPVRSHSLVCREKILLIVGIGSIRVKEL